MSSSTSQSLQLRAVFRRGKRFLRESRTKLLRRVGLLKGGGWQAGLPEELQFWEKALRDPDKNWNREHYRERTDPNFELEPELRALIPPGHTTVRILDVGSGPLTTVGKRWPGRELQIVAVDPLAREYDALFSAISLRPIIPITFAHGEKLLEVFSRDSFDLAHANNALDHCYDPLVVIEQMLAVVKPNCYVYLSHYANVGTTESYTGLHHWNFDIRRGAFVISNGRRTWDAARVFDGRAEVTCKLTQALGERVVVAKLRKLT